MTDLFIELILVSLGRRTCLSRTPSEREWKALFDMAQKQALTGVCFAGVTMLKSKADSSFSTLHSSLYYQWLALAAKIQDRNELMNVRSGEAVKRLRDKQFPCCVLKGQSMAKLYGELSMLRQSGDIDLWATGGRRKICELSMKMFGKVEGLTGRHIHFPVWDDVEVELHFTPGYLSNPFTNKRLQAFFRQYELTDNSSADAPWDFNVIYILQHCYNHFLKRGIGLRQLMDYYFLLMSNEKLGIRRSAEVRLHGKNYDYLLRSLGMKRFAQAVMWLLGYVFGLDSQHMICEPDEKEGRFLLREVMQTGNFGHQDERYNWHIASPVKRFIANQRWNLHLLTHYPGEILWSPLAAIYRYIRVSHWERIYCHPKSAAWDELQQLNTEL